jgi:hypothetical protein
MKKALVVLAVLCLTMALSCASSGGGSALSEPERQVVALPGDISGNLGDFTTTNQPSQRGWLTNGTDGKEVSLEIETVIAAKFLVLQLGSKPIGGLQLIWQGDGDGWSWNQNDGVLADDGTPNAAKGAVLSADNVLRIDLSKGFVKFDKIKDCTSFKMFLGYYSDDVSSLGITKADFEF